MEKVIINSYEDFEKLVGQQIGVSEYVELPQERINLFADATLDHQWIHVDTERAKNFIEHRIRKKYRLIVLRYPLYDGGTATHQTITFCKVLTLTHIADIDNKRSAQHYLQFRIGLQRTVKQGTVTFLPSFKIKRLFF